MKKSILFAFVMALLVSASARAAIVHHCDYLPQSATQDIHNDHGNGCSNYDSSDDIPREGECTHSSGFFNSSLQCSEFGCTVSGTINCNGTKHSYSLSCPGNNSRAFGSRLSAACISDQNGGSQNYAEVCSCEDFSGCFNV